MTDRAITLLRVSSEAQAGPDRMGLPAQREACKRVAKTHGLTIIDSVILEGVSGAAVLANPDFQRLLKRLADPDISGVIVADFDRLFRRGRFADFAILDAFVDTESRLFTADGVLDPSEEGGAFVSLFKGEMSGQERKRLAERTRRGREEKRKKGLRAEGLVGLPRGVTFDPNQATWSYVFPDAERVREAFRLYLESNGELSFAEIGRRAGIKTGNGSWAVRSLLRQPLYKGVYRVDRIWRDGKPSPRAPEDIHEHKVLDPPLVSPSDWARVQDLLARRKRPPRRQPDDLEAVYAGHIVCARCGGKLWIQPATARGAAAYLCRGAREGDCPTGHTSHRLADPQLDAQLELKLGTEESLRALIEKALGEGDRLAAGAVRDYERRLTEIENEKNRLTNAFVKARIDEERYDKQWSTIDIEARSIERLVAAEEQEAVEISPEVAHSLAQVFGLWAQVPRPEKRRIMADLGLLVAVSRPRKRQLKIEWVELQGFRSPRLMCKKMKKLGIE